MSITGIVWRCSRLKSLVKSTQNRGRKARWSIAACILFGALVLNALSQQTNLAVVVRHAPNLNGIGLIEGSVQQLLAENVTLSGGFIVAGDLFVPGTPALSLKGNPNFAGTITGSGSVGPTNYLTILNGNCSLNYLRTRTLPISLPAVSVPPQPSGSRIVTVNTAGDYIGDPTTLRDLTLAGSVGHSAIPPGTYGDFVANGGSGFILGVSGSQVPAIYNLQSLTLKGQSRLDVIGPVILTVANGFAANGMLGSSNHPSRLQLQIASGGLTLNGGCSVYGSVTAPAGTVIISGNSLLVGAAQCDRLVVNSGGIIRANETMNRPPVAGYQDVSVAEDSELSITLTGSDPEGGTLTYIILNQPSHGVLSGSAASQVYVPMGDFDGSDSFTFKVNDGQADSATATISITVTPINDAPTAQALTVSTPEDTSLNVTLGGSDVENTALTFEIIALPEHGSLHGEPPNLIYVPATNYSGVDRFTYVASDGQLHSAVATVFITVIPIGDAPVAADQTMTTDEDLAVSIQLTAVDAEGEELSFTVLTQPMHGSLSGTAPDLIYTPATNFNGNDSFMFRASDAAAGSMTATVTLLVQPVNDLPTGAPQVVVMFEDTATNVILNATDLDGDALSYVLEMNPTDGTLSGVAPSLVFSPNAEFHGTNTFTFVALDGVSTSAPVSITLIVNSVNDVPVAEAQTLGLIEDASAVITLTGADVDNDALTYDIAVMPANGTVTRDSQSPAHNVFLYTPNSNFHGADSFTFTVNDGAASSVPATVMLMIEAVNDPPFSAGQMVVTDEDHSADIALSVDDPENDPLAFTVLVPPAHGSLTGVAPHLTYTPEPNFNGIDAFEFQFEDGVTSSPPATVNIIVNPVNDPPEVTAGPDLRITVGETVQLVGIVTDDMTPAEMPLQVLWSMSNGSGIMQFDSPNSAITMARFSEVGTYVIRLTASDSLAEAYDEAVVTVLPVNRAPVVIAGPKQLVMQPAAANLTTTVTDDGLPEGATLTLVWSKVSGPGSASFSTPTAKDTAASFSATGDYVLRLTATDSALSSFADVRIAVRTPAMNDPPVVSVGEDLVVGLTNAVNLNAVVSDDGLPQGASLSVLWSVISGPGSVSFESAASANTRASFNAVGTYVLRATASDSESVGSDELNVTVYPYNLPPVVDAGAAQTITLPDPELLYPNPFGITNVGTSLSRSLFAIERWSNALGQPGLTGIPAGSVLRVAPSGLATDGGNLLVGGGFTDVNGLSAKSLARFNGTNWHHFYDTNQLPYLSGPGNDGTDPGTIVGWLVHDCGSNPFCNEMFGCVAIRGHEVFVGGHFKDLGNLDGLSDLSARWDGERWKSWGFKNTGGEIWTIKTTPDKVYVAGHFAFQPTNATSEVLTNLPWSYGVAVWDGTNWGTLGDGIVDIRDYPNPKAPWVNQFFHDITSMAIATNGDVYVAGEFLMLTPSGVASNVAKWNGTVWQPLGSGLKRNTGGMHATGMAIGDNGDLYVGGAFTNAGGYSVRNVARWDGNRWWSLGEGPANGVNGGVGAVAIHQRDIYVAGAFSEAGGIQSRRIAKWDGEFWSPLGWENTNGVGGSILALASDDTGVYVGGEFTEAGGLPANNLAKWEFSVPPVQRVEMRGMVTDDGLPYGGALSAAWTKISGPGEVTFANSALAKTTASFSKAGTYLLRLSASDSDLTGLDEVSITIRANQPPDVSGGPNHVIGNEEPLALNGYVSDDRLPEGAEVHHVWQQIYGPGSVTFDNAANTNATARFSQQGTYVLRLSANDSQFTVRDEVTVIVRDRNQPPSVFAGAGASVTFGDSHSPNSTVTDDGYPTNGTLAVAWSVFSGPGQVTFNDARLVRPTMSFSTNGVYLLRLTATDSELTSTGHVQITVSLPANNPPVVNAGTDQTLTNYSTRLQGSVSDDGKLLASALDVFWSHSANVSGVVFANSNSPTTAVTFNQSGSYTLTLNAKDGTFTASDTVTVTIPNQPPTIVDAGPDRSITLPTNSLSLTGYALDTSASTISWSRTTGPGTATFSGATTLTPTVTFSTTGTNVIRLRVSDSGVNYDDTMTVVVAPAGNKAPAVNAGLDQVVFYPTNSVGLAGVVSDDGFPIGSSVVSGWTQVAGPTATISDSSSLTPQVTLTGVGMHIFRLSAHDGSLTNGDEVVVTMQPQVNTPPQVFAGNDLVTRVTNTVSLSGLVTDDGLPSLGGLSAFWRKHSGPGAVTFGSPATNSISTTSLAVASTVSFSLPGTYVLRLQAEDSEQTASDDLTVTVLGLDDNQPPAVNAGLDASTVAYAPFILSGSVTDDGQPAAANVSVMWTFVSGPARVYFSDATVLMPYAQFSSPGTYRLRLLANDTRLTTFDDVIISVSAPTNQPPFVFAGLPLEVTRPFSAMLQGVSLDDGLPIGHPLMTTWSKVTGPGTVTFVPNANDLLAAANFSVAGEYTLRLEANDSEFVVQDDVIVRVLPGTNAPPLANAGPNFAATLSIPANLVTSVSDDGLESGLLLTSWSAVSGPGPVAFSTLNGDYRASFVTTGEYVLRLTASDGALTNSDEVVVTVYDEPAPTVNLISPTDSQIITAPTVIIGTAHSAILQSYVLEYRLAGIDSLSATGEGQGEVAWMAFASNAVSVVSNTLAVFDSTLLLNGIYELRLTATDLAGRSATTEPVSVIVDRNLKIGHFTISFNDLAMPLPGLPLQIIRTYDSRAAAAGIQGDFGVGWTLDIRNVRLQKNRPLSRNWNQTTTGSPFDLSLAYHLDGGKPRIVTITFPDGRVEKFQFQPNPMDQALFPIDYPQWHFVPLGNTRGALVPAGYDDPDGHFLFFAGGIPGTADLFDLNYFTDWLSSFATEQELRRYPTLFRYTTPEGYKYVIDEIAGLQSVTDPNNNTLLVSANALTWTNSIASTNSLTVAFQRDSLGRITNIVDAAGNSMRYAYSSNGNLIACVDRVGHTNRFAYTNATLVRHLTGIFDGRGTNVLKNAFDASGRLIATADAEGYVTSFGSDLSSYRTTVTNRLGFVTINDHDQLGRLVRKTDPLGVVTSYAYDAADNLITVSNGVCDCATSYTYDQFDNPTSETDELGHTSRYTCNALQKVSSYTDADGNVTTNSYDIRGNLLSTRDPSGAVTTFTYNSRGQVTQMTDARGGVSRFQYDSLGRLTSETNALGHWISYAVDANGNLTSSTRRRTLDFTPSFSVLSHDSGETLMCNDTNITHYRNIVPSYTYDGGGRLIAVVLPDGITRCDISYDANGKVTSTTNQFGQVTTTEYTASGKPRRISYPDGTSETFTYDAEGQLVTHVDRGDRQTLFTYDPNGRVTRVTYPDGRTANATYDFRGRLVSEKDIHHGTNTYTYDAVGNRISVTDPAGNTTRYTYNSKRACTSVTDALGRVTGLEYDALNRNTRITYPNGQSKRAEYLGRLVTSVTDEEGFTRTFAYDAVGRLIGATNALGQITRYQYDELDHLVIQTDPQGESTFHDYDDLGRRVRTTLPNGSASHFEYDSLGRMTAFADATGKTNRFGYNLRNNLVANTNAVGEITRFTYNNLGQRTSQTEPNGQINRWEYDSAGRLRYTIHPDGSRAETQYDSAGRIGAILDRAGGRTSFQYNVLDQVVSLNDPLNRTTTFGYDAVGNMTSQTDAAGRTTRFLYDNLNRQSGLILPDDTVESRAFNTRGGLASVTNALGHTTRFDYDNNGRLASVIDPLGGATRYSYDSRGQLTGVTNALGNPTIYVYDANGRLSQTIRADGSVEQIDYDSRGLTVSRTDALGYKTSYGYDGAGRLTSVTNALGHVTRYGRDSLGRMVSQTDANGTTTTFDYDTAGNLIRTTYADGTSESSLYDSAGRRVAETNANGNVTFYGYDLAGELTSVTNALHEVTRFIYDSLGQRVQSVDALDRTNQFAYDALGQLTRVIFPDGTAISHVYDGAGQIIASIDEAGVTNYFGYDAASRLTSVTNALGHVTTYAYDAVGQLVFETNANGYVTSYNYNPVNRLIRRTLPVGQFETFAYDLAGNLTNRTDFNGHACVYEYDALRRPLRKIPDTYFGEPPVTWAYDAVGLRTNMTDANGASAYRYDNRYRLLEKQRTWTSSGTSASLLYAYDSAGNVTNVLSTAVNGTTLAYSYDRVDRLASVIDPLNGTTAYAYDPAGNLATLTRPNGFKTTFSYDMRDRATNATTLDSALVVVSQYLYQYNLSGHRIAASETVIASGVPSTITRGYGYDTAYRLVTENLQINAQLATLNYSYDAAGNRLTRTSTLASLANQSFTYDANDQLTSDTYDANGNTLTSPLVGITAADRYDHSDRLIARSAAQPITFQYDGDGNRVARTAASVTTHFQTDEVNPTGWPQVLEEHTWIPGDPLFGTPAVTRTYSYGHAPLSQDQILGVTWSASHFGHDGHGNVRYLSSDDGTVTNTFDYDAFGNLIGRTGSTPVTRLFAGEEFDSDIGLYNLRARYHNPATGRFWTRDSFPGFLTRPASRHGYAYVENNPVNFSDPGGHYALAESMAVSSLSVPVGRMASSLWDSVNHYTHGLGGGEALKAVNSSEAFFIQGLSQHVGINLGRQNFFTTMQGAPFLLAHNPFVYYAPNDCFRYQILSFLPDAPIYGGANQHPVFTPDYSHDPMFQFAEKLADVGHGSLLGAGLREWATEQAMLGTQGGEGSGLWANFGYNVRSDVANMLAGAVSPQSWVDGMQQLQDRASTRMALELAAGEGDWTARYHGWASLGGDLLGLNGVLEGRYRVDLATGAELSTEESWRRGPGGLSQLAGVLTPGAASLKLRPVQTAKSLQALNGLEHAVAAGRPSGVFQRLNEFEPVPTVAAKGISAPENCVAASEAVRRRILGNIEKSHLSRQNSNFELHLARESQIYGAYGGVDPWTWGKLEKGTLVYGGVPGQTPYYFDFASANASGLNAEILWQSLQVAAHPIHGYRTKIQAYRVVEDINIPVGPTINNPHLGPGGAFQFYIRNFDKYLEPVMIFELH